MRASPNLRWLILAALFVARTSYAYQFQVVASSAAPINAELQIGYGMIGTLIGLYTLPGAFFSLPGGMLGARFGDRTVCVVGLLLMIGGGVVSGIGDTVLPLTVGRLITGIGGTLLSLVLIKMLTDWFAGREIVFAMGTMLSSWPFGIALGLVVQGPIADALGWRMGMVVTSLFCLVALVLLLAVYRAPANLPPPTQAVWWRPPDRRSLISVLVAATGWGCFNVGLITLFSFGASLLAVRGMPRLDAAAITSITLWIAILSIPLGGLLLQRSAAPRLVAAISYLLAAGGLAALYLGLSPILTCIVLGLAVGPGPGALMAMPSRVLRPEHRITGLAIFTTVNSAIMGVGPWIAGLLVDAAQTPAAAILLGVAMFIACVPLSILFELTRRPPDKPANL